MAANRSFFYQPSRFLFGQHLQPPEYRVVCSLFLRVLGVIYLIAFISFGVQVNGLIGSEGILPAGDFLERVHQALGFDSYRLVPTLFWISSSNAALMAVVAAGGVFSMLLILGFMPRFWLAPLFILYLSLVSAGQVFGGLKLYRPRSSL